MSINPITTTENIRSEYANYLKSMFLFKDTELKSAANKAIENSRDEIVKGPYLESAAMYKSGATLKELIDKGYLAKSMEKLVPKLGEYKLHKHQEKAIIKSCVEDKNMIVATGTGSGKTESFIIPILNHLVKQHENNELTPGVRALILYPMNALANDQLKRLREILKDYPEITFGRFTGETKKTRKEAIDDFKQMNKDVKVNPNELLSREEIRENPPHILLTNYAMLEYLLLRPEDNVFFDGPCSKNWKYIVLDEAHMYSGALGSEISYLLARVKDRVVDGEKGRIKFIATSATLGGGQQEIGEVVKYAKDLFDEDFTPDCLITSERVRTYETTGMIKPEFTWYSRFLELVNDYSGKNLAIAINKEKIYSELELKEDTNEVIYDALAQDYYINQLKLLIENKTLPIEQVIRNVFGSYNEEIATNFLAMVDLAARAKKDKNAEALFPARYHTFSKAIEGAFVSLYPKKEIYLNRKETKLINDEKVKVFELANCIKCGQEYLIGKMENDILRQSSGFQAGDKSRLDYFLLASDYDISEIDEDSIIDDEEGMNEAIKDKIGMDNTIPYLLCTKCGYVHPQDSKNKKECCDNPVFIKVNKIEHKGKVNSCVGCGSYSRGIVKRIVNADAPTTEMLARLLYQNIPLEKQSFEKQENNQEINSDSNNNEFDIMDGFDFFGINDSSESKKELFSEVEYIENNRKLLAFSDSRKEAAYFSSYMDIRYNSYLWRKIIYDAIKQLKEEDRIINFSALSQKIQKQIESHATELSDFGDDNIKQTIDAYLTYELMGYELDNGLEGVGLVSFKLDKPSWWQGGSDVLGLSRDEMWQVVHQIFQGLRKYRAMDISENVNYDNSIFGNRTNVVYFRYDGSKSGVYFKTRTVDIISIKPKEKYNNMRVDYLVKIFMKRGATKEEARINADKLLEAIFNSTKFIEALCNEGIYIKESIKDEGDVYKLNHNKWKFAVDEDVYVCDKCGKKTPINIDGVCPSYRCQGNLELMTSEDTRENYYVNIYNNIKRIPMKIKEHTAQLSSKHAGEIQSKFEKGEINILSCSTTFEMGVDLGGLEAVFLRNIPPETSNYVQRAGRAGRRTSSTAYILTYAKRRSHDLYYYQHPNQIIEGKIKAPYIEKNNEKLALRHLCSIVFSWMFRQDNRYYTDVKSMFAYKIDEYPAIDEKLKELLNQYPSEIKKSLDNVFNDYIKEYYDIENWKWVEEHLLNESGNLLLSKSKWESDVQEIEEIRKRNYEKGYATDSISRMLDTFLGKRVIDFLAGNNILPRYGFPIDSVELDTLHHGAISNQINLSRDLKMAISEFAPGSSVIANGAMWQSYSINKSRTKGWPTYLYAVCPDCKTIFKEPCDFNLKLSEVEPEKMICKNEHCGSTLKLRKFIKPIFGFSTNSEKPKKPTLAKPTSTYASKVFFHKYDENQRNYSGEIEYKGHNIRYTYSPRGNLFIVNQGLINSGFRICSWCGYSSIDNTEKKHSHKDKHGNTCANQYLNRIDLGHEIITDIIEIHLPRVNELNKESSYLSILYAVIEGAVGYLGIDRREVDGVLNYTTEYGQPSIILYDQVPGGAGHVKKIGKHIDKVMEEAKKRVSGLCGCGEDTSCYGCIRNYTNQVYHDELQRGDALKYFNKLSKAVYSEEVVSKKETEIKSNIYDYCEQKNVELPVEGYELELETGEMPICEYAFEEAKVAIFEQGYDEEKMLYDSNGWTTFFNHEKTLFEIADELAK